jgi:predicted transcriptional regulator
MVFQLVLVNHTPPTGSEDVDAVAAALLRDIGLLPGGIEVPSQAARRRRGRPRDSRTETSGALDPPRPGSEVLSSVPYRMVMDCFMRNPDQGFTVEELEERLNASRPTVYRHLLKLRELELLSYGEEENKGHHHRTYRLRFGRPSRSWRFVEANATCALDCLRDMVNVVWQEASERQRVGDTPSNLRLDRTHSRLTFKLPLTELNPPDRDSDEDTHLIELLEAVGYLTPWSTAHGAEETKESLAFKLFKDCLLDRAERSWTMRELMAVLHTSKPTLYRHLKKLERLDMMERGLRGESPRSSKAFRIRYGNLSTAWNFTEEHAKQALKSYRETIEHLEGLLEEGY